MSYRSDVYKSDGNVRSKSTVQINKSQLLGAHTIEILSLQWVLEVLDLSYLCFL